MTEISKIMLSFSILQSRISVGSSVKRILLENAKISTGTPCGGLKEFEFPLRNHGILDNLLLLLNGQKIDIVVKRAKKYALLLYLM